MKSVLIAAALLDLPAEDTFIMPVSQCLQKPQTGSQLITMTDYLFIYFVELKSFGSSFHQKTPDIFVNGILNSIKRLNVKHEVVLS